MKVISDGGSSIISNSYSNKYKRDYKPSTISGDRLEISYEARLMMEDNSVVRLDKVEKIKNLIDKGTYSISASETANKILNDAKLYNKFFPEKE